MSVQLKRLSILLFLAGGFLGGGFVGASYGGELRGQAMEALLYLGGE